MLQIKALFMGPIDEFITTRYALFNYNSLLAGGNISQQQYDFLASFPLHRIPFGYDQFKSNFHKILQNPSLNEFFLGKAINVTMMNQSPQQLDHYYLSFRASLNILLNFEFDFKNAYQHNRPIPATAFLTYNYANYLKILDLLTTMN